MNKAQEPSDKWSRIEDAFFELLQLTGESRQQRLAEMRLQDSELADEVEAMLELDASATSAIDSLLHANARSDAGGAIHGDIPPVPRIPGWTLIRPLGRGGMGWVWYAERKTDDFVQTAAIKVISQHLDSSDRRTRFLQERRILAQLDHPDIVRLIDGGVSETGAPYLAMDAVDGEPIDQWCDSSGVSIADRVRLMIRVLAAVSVAHEARIVHRDLKPEHVMVTPAGHPRILDFGIAKLLEQESTGVTLMGAGPGTSGWASPEQRRGDVVSERTDIYALGAVLYRLCTGRRPPVDPPLPVADSVVDEALQESSRVVPAELVAARRGYSVAELKRLLSTGLSDVIARATAAKPEDRFESAREFSEALEACLEHSLLAGEELSNGNGASTPGRRLRQALVAVLLIVSGGVISTAFLREGKPAVVADNANSSISSSNAENVSSGEVQNVDPFWEKLTALQQAQSTGDAQEFRKTWTEVVASIDEQAKSGAGDNAIERSRQITQYGMVSRLGLRAGYPELVFPLAEKWSKLHDGLGKPALLRPSDVDFVMQCVEAAIRIGEVEAALPLLAQVSSDEHVAPAVRYAAQLQQAKLSAALGNDQESLAEFDALRTNTEVDDAIRQEAALRYTWLEMKRVGPWEIYQNLANLTEEFRQSRTNGSTPEGRLLFALKMRNHLDRAGDAWEGEEALRLFFDMLPRRLSTMDLESLVIVVGSMTEQFMTNEASELIALAEDRFADTSPYDLHVLLSFDNAHARILSQMEQTRSALNTCLSVQRRMRACGLPPDAPVSIESKLTYVELMTLTGRASEVQAVQTHLLEQLDQYTDERWRVVEHETRLAGTLQSSGDYEAAINLSRHSLEKLADFGDTPRARIVLAVVMLGHVVSQYEVDHAQSDVADVVSRVIADACAGYSYLGSVADQATRSFFTGDEKPWGTPNVLYTLGRILHAEEAAHAVRERDEIDFGNAVGELSLNWLALAEAIEDPDAKANLLWDALQSVASLAENEQELPIQERKPAFIPLKTATDTQLQLVSSTVASLDDEGEYGPIRELIEALAAALDATEQGELAAAIRAGGATERDKD